MKKRQNLKKCPKCGESYIMINSQFRRCPICSEKEFESDNFYRKLDKRLIKLQREVRENIAKTVKIYDSKNYSQEFLFSLVKKY